MGRATKQIFVNYGPMQMAIQAVFAEAGGDEILQKAGCYAKELLKQVAENKTAAAMSQGQLPITIAGPEVFKRMVAAVRQSTDTTLTPMAAVAGAIADMTADYVAQLGALKVIVNNGGDIAIRLQDGQTVCVGVNDGSGKMASVRIDKASGIGGIATSGLGGRSFTKGIASAAVVTAASAALADAAATSLGNAVYAKHPHIHLVPAEQLDPATDIRGHYVVKEAGILPPEVIQAALENGGSWATALFAKGVIYGAAAFIDGQAVFVPEMWLKTA